MRRLLKICPSLGRRNDEHRAGSGEQNWIHRELDFKKHSILPKITD
jgi:hypothetical protein